VTKSRFTSAKQRQVAALLRQSPRSGSELLEIMGSDKTALKRCLERLKGRGLVDYLPSATGAPAPGHPAGLWSLTQSGREAIESDLKGRAAAGGRETSQASGTQEEMAEDDDSPPTTTIHDGHTLVNAVVAPAAAAELMSVLANGELTAAAAWVARVDGDGRGYLFAFAAELGNQPVENLCAALQAIGATCVVSSVRAVQPPREFIRSVRTAHTAAERALGRRGV
jgi:DNA-binding MarR family transcriptional regulator